MTQNAKMCSKTCILLVPKNDQPISQKRRMDTDAESRKGPAVQKNDQLVKIFDQLEAVFGIWGFEGPVSASQQSSVMVNGWCFASMVPCVAVPDDGRQRMTSRVVMKMSAYEDLLDRIRTAIFAAMSEPSEFDQVEVIESQLMEEAFEVVDEVMPAPEAIDAEWVNAMLSARPDILKDGTGEKGTVAEAIIWGVGNSILAEPEPEIFEHARQKGFARPQPPMP